jgi:hypothetical protein
MAVGGRGTCLHVCSMTRTRVECVEDEDAGSFIYTYAVCLLDGMVDGFSGLAWLLAYLLACSLAGQRPGWTASCFGFWR